MRKFAGSVNHRFYPGEKQATSAFVAAYKFLSSSYCQSIGVQLIAYNTGSVVSGAMNYPNYYSGSILLQSPGSNCWACFKFASASNPFFVLIQSSEPGTTFGATPGSPAAVPISTQNGMFAFAASAIEGGGLAWNGTTRADGNDSKGTPVWVTSSYCFPRQNNLSGSRNTNKEALMPIKADYSQAASSEPTGWYGNFDFGLHFLADQNNLMIINEIGSGKKYHYIHWIGQYKPSQINNSPVTLAAISHYQRSYCEAISGPAEITDNNGGDVLTSGLYGGINGPAHSLGGDGGIAIKSGSTPSVRTLNVDWYMMAKNWNAHPNLIANSPKTVFNPANLFLLVAEAPYYGYAGFIDFFKFVSDVTSQSTFNGGKYAYFPGGNTSLSEIPNSYAGVIVPWDSSARSPGAYFGREGVQFIRNE